MILCASTRAGRFVFLPRLLSQVPWISVKMAFVTDSRSLGRALPKRLFRAGTIVRWSFRAMDLGEHHPGRRRSLHRRHSLSR
jgi:hypothetical protein